MRMRKEGLSTQRKRLLGQWIRLRCVCKVVCERERWRITEVTTRGLKEGFFQKKKRCGKEWPAKEEAASTEVFSRHFTVWEGEIWWLSYPKYTSFHCHTVLLVIKQRVSLFKLLSDCIHYLSCINQRLNKPFDNEWSYLSNTTLSLVYKSRWSNLNWDQVRED